MRQVDGFEAAAGRLLLEREAENCVIIGLCSQIRTGATSIQNCAPYFAVAKRGNDVVGAALIAGSLALLSNPIDEAALPSLVADMSHGRTAGSRRRRGRGDCATLR